MAGLRIPDSGVEGRATEWITDLSIIRQIWMKAMMQDKGKVHKVFLKYYGISLCLDHRNSAHCEGSQDFRSLEYRTVSKAFSFFFFGIFFYTVF